MIGRKCRVFTMATGLTLSVKLSFADARPHLQARTNKSNFHDMNTRTRNEIARWLLDRVAQGEREEVGSMDSREFDGYFAVIMKDKGNEFPVWLDDVFCPDFTLTPEMTESEVRKIIKMNA